MSNRWTYSALTTSFSKCYTHYCFVSNYLEVFHLDKWQVDHFTGRGTSTGQAYYVAVFLTSVYTAFVFQGFLRSQFGHITPSKYISVMSKDASLGIWGFPSSVSGFLLPFVAFDRRVVELFYCETIAKWFEQCDCLVISSVTIYVRNFCSRKKRDYLFKNRVLLDFYAHFYHSSHSTISCMVLVLEWIRFRPPGRKRSVCSM